MLAVYLRPRFRFPPSLGSHTIFGAICSALGELEGFAAVTDLLERFKNEEVPPFLVSEAFPYLFGKDIGVQRFWPLPIGPALSPVGRTDEWFRAAKELKGRVFLHEPLLAAWTQGELYEERLLEAWTAQKDAFGPQESSSGLLWRKEALPENLEFTMQEHEVPHNVLDRLTIASTNFFHTPTGFYQNAGLWFVVQATGEDLRLMQEALWWLADTRGFGSDISTGAGQFTLGEGSFEPLEGRWLASPPETGGRALALSGVCPNRAPSTDSYYNLLELRGYSARGRWDKRVRLLAPGSTFPWNERPQGRFVEVIKQQDPTSHPVYLYGLGFYLKLKEAF